MLASIEKVTGDEVLEIARDFFAPRRFALTMLGNLNGFQATLDHLSW